jgi:putative peptide zinc metalloprotease protein
MAYTDTNDAWRLISPRQRLMVSSAGILTELMLACWATALWGLLPDGPARSAAFVLATTSWISTLLINASPFMRFDGYFILSDSLDLPNLHERCFAMARWKLREWLFGLGEPAPENVHARRRRWMIAFAWCTWIYRLVLFIGIALLVYHFFFKALGIFLFVVEIAWFIIRPLRSEAQAWLQRRGLIMQSGRSAITLLIALAVLGVTFIPWPGRVTASAVLRPADFWPIHAAGAARVDALPFGEGDRINEGELVMRLKAPELDRRREILLARIEQLRWQAAAAGFDPQTREKMMVSEELLVGAQAELVSVEEELKLYSPRAPFGGQLRDLDPELHQGQWVGSRERLAILIRENSRWLVETWLEESAIASVRLGDRALFVRDAGTDPPLELQIEAIDQDASRTLPRPELSVQQGGHILVRPHQGGQLVPERAIFRVVLSLVDGPPAGDLSARIARGRLTIHGQSQAPAINYLNRVAAVLVREFGF